MSDRIEFGNNKVLEGNLITVNGKQFTEAEYRDILKKKKEEELKLLEAFQKGADKLAESLKTNDNNS